MLVPPETVLKILIQCCIERDCHCYDECDCDCDARLEDATDDCRRDGISVGATVSRETNRLLVLPCDRPPVQKGAQGQKNASTKCSARKAPGRQTPANRRQAVTGTQTHTSPGLQGSNFSRLGWHTRPITYYSRTPPLPLYLVHPLNSPLSSPPSQSQSPSLQRHLIYNSYQLATSSQVAALQMTAAVSYDFNVGLGISFDQQSQHISRVMQQQQHQQQSQNYLHLQQQQQHHNNRPLQQSRSRGTPLVQQQQQQPRTPTQPQYHRSIPPQFQDRSFAFNNFPHAHTSAVLQGNFDDSLPYYSPHRSPPLYAHTHHDQRATMSAPTTPYAGTAVSLQQQAHQQSMNQRFLYECAYSPAEGPNISYPTSDFCNSPGIGEDPIKAEGSPIDSYFYQTPVMSTPFSDQGRFHTPQMYSSSMFNTPGLVGSPPLTPLHGHRRYKSLQEDDMPSTPYVPTSLTNFPPQKHYSKMPKRKIHHDAFAEAVFGSYTPTLDEFNDLPEQSFSPSGSSSPSLEESQPKDRKVKYSRWTATEDDLLRAAITRNGDGKWSLIAACVPGRTPMQCSTRWQGALNTSIHKGRWDPEEDAILIRAVAEWQAYQHQTKSESDDTDEEGVRCIPWSNIASLLPKHRTGVQALARWSEALDPRIRKGKWTLDEDTSLMRGVTRYGRCWIKIAAGVDGRTQRQCRTRYCQIATKKKGIARAHDGEDLSDTRFSE